MSPSPVTSEVDTVIAFVNTRADGAGRLERFGDSTAYGDWLREHSEFGAHALVTEADAAAARELREALVTVLLAHAGDEAGSGESLRDAESQLLRAGQLYPLTTIVTADAARLSPHPGAPQILGTVLAAVTAFAQSGDWGRIKACRNPPCHLGFFDRTKNGRALYCSPGCGSQVSMRNYRQRQRDKVGDAGD